MSRIVVVVIEGGGVEGGVEGGGEAVAVAVDVGAVESSCWKRALRAIGNVLIRFALACCFFLICFWRSSLPRSRSNTILGLDSTI